MSTSKRNVTREVLLERERGKAGASWLYADHVVVLREFMRCMRGQRSSLGFFVIFIYIFFFMSGECEPRCDSSGNGEPRREAF